MYNPALICTQSAVNTDDMERELVHVATEALRPTSLSGRVRLLAVAAPLLVLGLSACETGDESYTVGDCVTIEERVLDFELESADCSDATGTFDASERTYRVDSVIDGTDGGCPALAGFFPVKFVDQPAGITYCLVQES